MKGHYLVKPAIFIFASFLYLMRGMEAKAEETVDMNTSIGGMGLAIEEYYEDRLSESGISISNVTTTFYVNGEKLEAIQRGPSPYEGLVFSNTQILLIFECSRTQAQRSQESFTAGVLQKCLNKPENGPRSYPVRWRAISSQIIFSMEKKQRHWQRTAAPDI